MMATTMVPLAEYLDTTYRPDRDWIGGELRERNVGEQPHSAVQGFLAYLFRANAELWGVRSFPEQRVQTSSERYRIVDLCVVQRQLPLEPIVRTPPMLCVEILSRDDRMSEIQERVDDYLQMGALAVWVIDPRRRKAFHSTTEGALLPVRDTLAVPGTQIIVPVSAIFVKLDELEESR